MEVNARYLADKSALARSEHPKVSERLRPFLEGGQIATCAMTDLEMLYSARNLRDYEGVLLERNGFEDAPITPQVMGRAIEIQHALAKRGQHRCPIPDLVIAAAAEASGLAILHYDADFERIAKAAKVPHEWVVKRGTI